MSHSSRALRHCVGCSVSHKPAKVPLTPHQVVTSWGVPKRGQGVACRAPLCHFSVSAFVGRVIAVGMNPGQTAFTLIRRGPKVTANWSVKLTTAAFEALWEEWLPSPMRAVTDAMFTIFLRAAVS